MSANRGPIDAAITGAGRVVREIFGDSIAISQADIIAARGRSTVIRCVVTPQSGTPYSLIAKLHTSDDARGFSDWAGLAFLTSMDTPNSVAPRFYGGDPYSRLYLMEDLGPAQTIADLMTADDAAPLRQALRSLAETMAQLVVTTAGNDRETRYQRLRDGLPGSEGLDRRVEARRWRESWPRVVAWFEALGCPLDPAMEETIDQIATDFAEPGPFLAYSHGDPAPSNNQIGRKMAWLLDFEYGTYRHALYDLSGWYILCPLPEIWAAEMHATFRQNLVDVWPPLDDEVAYRTGWGTLCAYRALAILSWLPLDIIVADRPWAEGWTMRGALLTAATRLGRATAGIPELAMLGEAATRLARAARLRWPELGSGLPAWPADADHIDSGSQERCVPLQWFPDRRPMTGG